MKLKRFNEGQVDVIQERKTLITNTLQKVSNGEMSIEDAQNIIEGQVSYGMDCIDGVEGFAREAFYKGREIKRYDEHGRAIFERPTYNGFLREMDKKELPIDVNK